MSDLIERGDAIKALYKYNFVTKEVIEREIMSIPSADRPRGEWIRQRDPTRIIDEYHCSCCDYSPKYRGIPIIPTSATMLYCPCCGARMKGADDEHRG